MKTKNCLQRKTGSGLKGLTFAVLFLVSFGTFADVILETRIISGGDRKYVRGTDLGLIVNQPESVWLLGASWDWSKPYISAVWDPPGVSTNVISLGEEKTALGLSIVSTNTYTKPIQMRLTAIFEMTSRQNNVAGVGFWSELPPYENGHDSRENFTGVLVQEVEGTVQVYAAGARQGAAVYVKELSKNTFYSLSVEVDITTGTLLGFWFDDEPLEGLEGDFFTDEATAIAGVLSSGSSRVSLASLLLEGTFVPPDPTTLLLIQ